MLVVKDNYSEIIEYIGEEYFKCLYLYLDLIKYKGTDKIKVWAEKEKDNISCVILKYYSGMHIYSKDKVFNYSALVDIIFNEKPSAICAEKDIIIRLEKALDKNFYI